MNPNNKKHIRKIKNLFWCSKSGDVSKSSKAMTTDEMLISVQESRDKYVKDLQQENTRLKELVIKDIANVAIELCVNDFASKTANKVIDDTLENSKLKEEIKSLRQALKEINNIVEKIKNLKEPNYPILIADIKYILYKILKGEKR